MDGASEASTNKSTPLKHPAPIDSEPNPPRQPSERRDSYFPVSSSTEEPPPSQQPPLNDLDPELTGPLGLTNEVVGDQQFLTALDDKLLSAAAASMSGDPSNVNGDEDDGREEDEGGEGEEGKKKQPGHKRNQSDEPTLRLKKSMNFGTQFGQL